MTLLEEVLSLGVGLRFQRICALSIFPVLSTCNMRCVLSAVPVFALPSWTLTCKNHKSQINSFIICLGHVA